MGKQRGSALPSGDSSVNSTTAGVGRGVARMLVIRDSWPRAEAETTFLLVAGPRSLITRQGKL